MTTNDVHRDLFQVNVLTGSEKFVRRLSLDDPMLVAEDGLPTQLAVGWSTYYHVSEPHTLTDCPQTSERTLKGDE